MVLEGGHTQGFLITCSECGEETVKNSKYAKFCSDECRHSWHNKHREDKDGAEASPFYQTELFN